MKPKQYSDEDLLKLLAGAIKIHGPDISWKTMEGITKGKGMKALKLRWESWKNAKEAAVKYLEQGKVTKGKPSQVCDKNRSHPYNGLSETDLRRKHDTVFKVAEMAEKIEPGQFFPEADFVTSLRLKGGYRAILERQQFEKYRGKADGGVVYWGHPVSIRKLKDERVLS
jgi:hypothetical protein